MSLQSLTVQLLKIGFSVLCFLASPGGGRDMGREFLELIGLRNRGSGNK